MVKLDVMKILHCAINSEAGIVLSLFLIFGDFEPQCFYKIVLIEILEYCYQYCYQYQPGKPTCQAFYSLISF